VKNQLEVLHVRHAKRVLHAELEAHGQREALERQGQPAQRNLFRGLKLVANNFLQKSEGLWFLGNESSIAK
jgi:hypothetical protein